MPTTRYYNDVISKIPPGVERKVYNILTAHVGEVNAIPLRELTERVFGAYTSTTERQCREAIETLRRDYRIPVLSHSGKPGRWLAATSEELRQTVAELETRRRHLDAVIQALRSAHIPARDPFTEKTVQRGLF